MIFFMRGVPNLITVFLPNNLNHYRSVDEVRYWDQKDHPITKFASYLIKKGLWDESKEVEWKESSRKEVSKIWEFPSMYNIDPSPLRHFSHGHSALITN